jgi:hypothetical protein
LATSFPPLTVLVIELLQPAHLSWQQAAGLVFFPLEWVQYSNPSLRTAASINRKALLGRESRNKRA